jgi:hypothetical protein
MEEFDDSVLLCKTCNHYSGMHYRWQIDCLEDNCKCKWFEEK